MSSSINLYTNLILEKLFLQKNFLRTDSVIESTDGTKISISDFLLQIDSVAYTLVESGFKVNDKVLFLAKPSIQSVIYIFGIIRAGGALVLADPTMGRDNFIGRVSFAAPSYVLLDPVVDTVIHIPGIETLTSYLKTSLPDVKTLKSIPSILVRNSKHKNFSFNEIRKDDEEDSVIIFTSGTTGTPKGVVHSYRSLFEILSNIEAMLHIKQNDIFYSSQLHFLLAAILSGARIILPHTLGFNAQKFYDDIVRYNVNKTFGIPAEYNKIMAYLQTSNKKLPESLETIILGSAPVLKGFLSKLEVFIAKSTQVICVYGATEILPIAHIDLIEKILNKTDGDVLGKVVDGVSVTIVDGEICVSGKSLFTRYLGGENVTLHKTGDLGVIENSELLLLGRKKDMIIRNNNNIYPTIFESTISMIPGVKNSAMVGIYSKENDDEKIYIVIEREGSSLEVSDEAFKGRLLEELTHGKHSIDAAALPDKIILMKIPLSGRTQKIDKTKIKEYICTNNLC